MNNLIENQRGKQHLEQAKRALKISSCGTCRALELPPPCRGHGKKEGGGGSNSDEKNTLNNKLEQSMTNAIPASSKEAHDFTVRLDKSDWIKLNLFSDNTIDYTVGLIAVSSDKLRGILVIQFRSELTKDAKEDAYAFLRAVKYEFEEVFKKQLASDGINTKNYTAELEDGQLRISIPNPVHYQAFIVHLEKNNLLPIPHSELYKETHLLNGKNLSKPSDLNFSKPLNPLPSPKPGRVAKKENKELDEEGDQSVKRSFLNPFSTKLIK